MSFRRKDQRLQKLTWLPSENSKPQLALFTFLQLSKLPASTARKSNLMTVNMLLYIFLLRLASGEVLQAAICTCTCSNMTGHSVKAAHVMQSFQHPIALSVMVCLSTMRTGLYTTVNLAPGMHGCSGVASKQISVSLRLLQQRRHWQPHCSPKKVEGHTCLLT